MGKRRIIITICLVAIAGIMFGSGVAVGAAGNGAGSQNDPVVSLSYLDYRLGKLEGGGNSAGAYTKINLSKGERFTPGEGSVIIVYSGNASVIGSDGLINISEGTLFPADYSIVLYNQFLVPGKESGIKAEGNVTLYVLR